LNQSARRLSKPAETAQNPHAKNYASMGGVSNYGDKS
jgi:hypothetical protein